MTYVCYSLESTGRVLKHIGGSISQISCQGEPVHAYWYLLLKSQSSEVPKEGSSILSLIEVKEITFFDLSIITINIL